MPFTEQEILDAALGHHSFLSTLNINVSDQIFPHRLGYTTSNGLSGTGNPHVLKQLLNNVNTQILLDLLPEKIEQEAIIPVEFKNLKLTDENLYDCLYKTAKPAGSRDRDDWSILISRKNYNHLDRTMFLNYDYDNNRNRFGVNFFVDFDLPDNQIIIYKKTDFLLELSTIKKRVEPNQFNDRFYLNMYDMSFDFKPVCYRSLSFDLEGSSENVYKPIIGIIHIEEEKERVYKKSNHGRINKLTVIE